jgi:hypothetical protein
MQSPQVPMHFGGLCMPPAPFGDLAFDPARDVWITLQQLAEGAAGIACNALAGWLDRRASVVRPRVLIRDQCAAAEDSTIVVLHDASLEDAIKGRCHVAGPVT